MGALAAPWSGLHNGMRYLPPACCVAMLLRRHPSKNPPFYASVKVAIETATLYRRPHSMFWVSLETPKQDLSNPPLCGPGGHLTLNTGSRLTICQVFRMQGWDRAGVKAVPKRAGNHGQSIDTMLTFPAYLVHEIYARELSPLFRCNCQVRPLVQAC